MDKFYGLKVNKFKDYYRYMIYYSYLLKFN